MKLLREPLMHFLVIGAALFGVFRFTGAGGEPEFEEIIVSAGEIASIEAVFSRTWQRPPTAKESDALVDEYIRDEVLYREGVAMGLDRDDPVIRRRVRQKMEFVSNLAADIEPTDAELKAFAAEHPEWFRTEPSISFSHVYFRTTPNARPSNAELEIQLQALNGGNAVASETGDPFMAGFDFRNLPRSQMAQIFGESFAESIDRAEAGRWEGPVASAYGTHLIRVTERLKAREPPFEEIREAARREWLHVRTVEANDALYGKLRSRYVIKVEAGGEILAEAQP
ncbi:peptidyl-prolyl cis-trans isomerase [Sinorhizobium meliloti]|uniref:peptidylprolyl isomerase n=1 Tax=Rhizobium meliloti TaxID=382 RepID=UPI000D1DC749|nr:peptidylprolyl isomerase [Sinorhizobium meliloti]RMI15687.1 peptidyl-prolyl cis-trans isomerase [Sinorhizobium meliloti]